MILAKLSPFGTDPAAIWEFAAGILVFLLALGLVLVGIVLIRELIR